MSAVIKFSLTLAMYMVGCATLLSQQEKRGVLLEKINVELTKIIDKKVGEVPAGVRRGVIDCESASDFVKLPEKSQIWLDDNLDHQIFFEFTNMLSSLPEIHHGGDIRAILKKSFWCRLKGLPYNLNEEIGLIDLYWKEVKKPSVVYSPLGKGKVNWAWRLEIKSRPHGIIHVGMDTKSRRFLCYDRTIGVFYPEGLLLDRIRTEIVRGNSWEDVMSYEK